ncbi:uncharacterized protein MJAP1_003725 [Malassezia japonica]|uniref:Exonuclease V, mitochondrial n=1 Tax=Malassezia japonica TaxID=223818 RepID=A0AAF0F6L5_9BASI|nr:uncharacterized protein MJAP1_003725 [Malassezia japonica]WFD40736.1 hypothetical protein MJAP1_003725 [Malassezia japonica]
MLSAMRTRPRSVARGALRQATLVEQHPSVARKRHTDAAEVQCAPKKARARTPRRRTPPPPPESITEHVARKTALSVTDLVSPSWCEYAYLYNILAQSHLPLWKRPQSITTPDGNVLTPSWAQLQAREEVLARGTEIHDALEREVQPVELTFRFETPADEWALYVLQFAASLCAARRGRAREVPVLGFVHGRLVRGIVDELRFEKGGVVVSDTKTRHSARLPSEADQMQARLQCMLYKRLIDGLYTGITGTEMPGRDPHAEPVAFAAVAETLRIDLDARLSDAFLQDVAEMIATTATPWHVAQVDGLSLRTAVDLAREALLLLLQDTPMPIGEKLELVYVCRGNAKPLGVEAFADAPDVLQTYLYHLFTLLRGVRRPEGVDVQSTRRCDSCAWREGCEWRAAQASAALERVRPAALPLPVAFASSDDEALWSEFSLDHLVDLQW